MAKISEKAFATLEDLESVYQQVAESEQVRANALLLQVSNYLRQIAFNNSCDLDDRIAGDASGVFGANVKMVVTAAVQRVLSAPTDMVPDATQWSQSASPYSESMSFPSGTSGGVYFKERELKLLGFRNTAGNRQFAVLKGAR